MDQGIPWPFGMNLETTSARSSEIHPKKPKIQTEKNIPTPWHPEKGEARPKTIVITRKSHATDNKRTIHQQAKPCMSKPTRKSNMQYATCKYS